MEENIRNPQPHFPIICLAGSAGGLGAYKCILECLPANYGFAIVLVSHRGTDHTALLSKLLSLSTTLKVIEVTDGMPLRPNCIFLCPPRMEITTDGLILNVQDRTKTAGWPNIVDIFLASLADSRSSGSIAVILSGMGFDGSGSLESLKKVGGVTFAQSDALFASMPQAAIDTGFIDFVLSAAEIGGRLAAMAAERNPPVAS